MIITEVLQNTESKLWAVVETSDENENYFVIREGKEFETEQEAREFLKTLFPPKPRITVATLYELIESYNDGEISISRLAEILNAN